LTRALALVLLLAVACKDEPPAPETKPASGTAPDFANAFKHSERWDPAKKARVVEVTVAPGYHAYTTGETTGKPLLVEIAADSDLVGAGEIEYPKGIEKTLPLGRSVIVEGNVQIVAPIAPKDPAVTGPKKGKGTLRYQVCTDQACDRPRTVPVQIDVPG
jgi:hypothetical protein